jgi:hypothetical protein
MRCAIITERGREQIVGARASERARESAREKERERVIIFAYIYIYVERERQRERERGGREWCRGSERRQRSEQASFLNTPEGVGDKTH